MWRNLQSRLTISHLLPLLVIVPLLSFLLFYLIEARFVLDEATAELAGQGELISRLYQAELAAQEDPEQAGTLFARLQFRIPTLFYVVDRNGNVVVKRGLATASTEVPIRQPDPELLQKALAGEIARRVSLGNADVAVPVRNEDQEIVGAVHLSQQLTQVNNRLGVLRWTVWGAVSAGLLVSIALSFALSRSLNKPLERLTRASRAVSFDARPALVEEEGPTEVQTLARTFNEMSERLFELEQGRRRLLSAVVHELGRPLGAIKAAAQVLRQNGQDSDMVVELSSGIDDQVDQLRRLLDDLALLARNDIQDLALDIVPTDIGSLILEECRRYDARIQEKEIALSTGIGQETVLAEADPMRTSQIIGNLLDNAIKYTPNGGQIRIAVGSEDDRVVLSIEDTGPGIDPSERERIFDFLYRSPRQERVREGMGIGLALSRRLAEAQGGTLTARLRAEGRGAQLILTFRGAAHGKPEEGGPQS